MVYVALGSTITAMTDITGSSMSSRVLLGAVHQGGCSVVAGVGLQDSGFVDRGDVGAALTPRRRSGRRHAPPIVKMGLAGARCRFSPPCARWPNSDTPEASAIDEA